jgi:hypothetical protein
MTATAKRITSDKIIETLDRHPRRHTLAVTVAERCVARGREDFACELLRSRDRWETTDRGVRMRWVKVAEILGQWEAAEQILSGLLADDKGAVDVHLRLARIALERNRIDEVKRRLRTAVASGVPREKLTPFIREVKQVLAAAPTHAEPALAEERFSRIDLEKRAVRRFLRLFRGRQGCYARQWYDRRTGRHGYHPVMHPMTAEVVRKHLAGTWTIGQYLLRQDNTVDFAAFDLDVAATVVERSRSDTELRSRVAGEMRRAMEAIRDSGSDVGMEFHFERSGRKGVHAWLFFAEPVAAVEARTLLEHVAGCLPLPGEYCSLEIFPKQTCATGKGFGNLIKLPLGHHQVGGGASRFITPAGKPIENGLSYLLEIRPVQAGRVQEALDRLRHLRAGDKVAYLPPREASPVIRPDEGDDITAPGCGEADAVIKACAVMQHLVRRARAMGELSFAERKVLVQTLGHLPDGRKAVLEILSTCRGYVPEAAEQLLASLPGKPLGCNKIHRLLYYIEQDMRCARVDPELGYATPVAYASRTGKPCRERSEGKLSVEKRISRLEEDLSELKRILRGSRGNCLYY